MSYPVAYKVTNKVTVCEAEQFNSNNFLMNISSYRILVHDLKCRAV